MGIFSSLKGFFNVIFGRGRRELQLKPPLAKPSVRPEEKLIIRPYIKVEEYDLDVEGEPIETTIGVWDSYTDEEKHDFAIASMREQFGTRRQPVYATDPTTKKRKKVGYDVVPSHLPKGLEKYVEYGEEEQEEEE